MKSHLWILVLALAPQWLEAQSVSSSASYELLHAPAGDTACGGPVANAGSTVTAEVSAGDPVSGEVSQVTPSSVQAKTNLVGQLYDVTGLSVSATPGTVDELSTRLLDATAMLDDATMLALDPADVLWSEHSDALSGISTGGVASAGPVWQTTVANVNGIYGLFTDPDGFDLTVLDLGETDAFGTYGGDGIDDGWQVNFFGQPPNPAAGPGENPDGDPDDNLVEFFTGGDPNDPADWFAFGVVGHAGNTAEIELSRVIPGRIYTVTASPDLATPFSPVGTPFSVASEETNHLFQDTAAITDEKFYRVEITKP